MSASFDSYKIFYYVGKFNNITHAANALFLSQSTVSRSIQSLESELGCKLFERFQHGVVLTAEGEMLYHHISQACEQIMLGEEKIRLLHSESAVHVKLGVDNFIFTQFILPLMKDFQRVFPEVCIETCSNAALSHENSVAALTSGQVNAVFTLAPFPETPGIVAVNLGEYNDVFISGKNFHELKGDNIRLYDISLRTFGSLNGGISGAKYVTDTFAAHGMRVEPSYIVEDLHHLLRLVDMGLCLALVPEPLWRRHAHSGSTFAISTNASLPKRNICLLVSKNNPQNAASDELIKRIKKNIQGSLI